MDSSSIDINFDGVEIQVDYDFSPAEKQTRIDPGCEAEFDITGVFIDGVDWIDNLTDKTIAAIKEAAIESIKEEQEQY